MRIDYINWDEYLMGIAILSAMRSKDPSTQVGACIVGRDNRIISTGYNGATNGFPDLSFPWEIREGGRNKYDYVCHAEFNACALANRDLNDCVLYTQYLPCCNCAKSIVQHGIKEVVCLKENKDDKSKTKWSKDATLEMFEYAGVKVRYIEETEFLFNLQHINNKPEVTVCPENSIPIWVSYQYDNTDWISYYYNEELPYENS